MSQKRFIPWEIYQNLQEFLKYRKATTDYTFLQQDAFMSKFNIDEYILVNAKSADGSGLYIFLI